MRVIDIVRVHLQTHGYDGLVQTDARCGCRLDDLVPCGSLCDDCEPAFVGVDSDDPTTWAMYRSKEAAQASRAASGAAEQPTEPAAQQRAGE
jgi:hypothetical protein